MSRFFYGEYARQAEQARQVGQTPPARGPRSGAPPFTEPAGAPAAGVTGTTGTTSHMGSSAQALADAYATLWLKSGAPEPVVKAAYRALAQRYHPDAGGDGRIMARINGAYATIRAHLAAGGYPPAGLVRVRSGTAG
jgi:hypothetical protein